MNPPREHIFVNATDAERTYSDAQLAADRATARAIAANHPSVYRSGISAQPPSDAMPVGAGSAAAESAPVFDDFHATCSTAHRRTSTLTIVGSSAESGRREVPAGQTVYPSSADTLALRPALDVFAVPSSLPELETHVSGIGAAARRLAAQVARRDRGRE